MISDVESELPTLLCVGRARAHEVAAIHYHQGGERVRVLGGDAKFVVGDTRRRCVQGDLVVIPPSVSHGFVAGASGVVMEVVVEQDMGPYYSIMADDGARRDVEVRPGVPWDATALEGEDPHK